MALLEGFSPLSHNVMYEAVRERNGLEAFKQSLIDYPRRTVQITCGAQAREAKAYAQDLVAETPTQHVIYRVADDDTCHLRWSVADTVRRLKDHARGGLVPSYNNEPGNDTLDKLEEHSMDVMKAMADALIPVVAFNWQTGGITDLEKRVPSQVQRMARACKLLGHWWADHQYINSRYLEIKGNQLYIGRHRYITAIAPGLKVVHTEFGFDSRPPRPNLNGWKTHVKFWEQEFPGMTPEAVYWQEAMKAEQDFYAEDDTDLLWYSYGYDPARPDQFDYFYAEWLIQKMNTYRRKAKPPVAVEIVEITKFPPTITTRNIRTEPSASAQDIGDLKVGDVVQLTLPLVNQWARVRVTKGESKDTEGWALFSGVEYQSFTEPVPSPPPPPPVEPAGIYVDLPEVLVTPQQREALATLLTALGTAVRDYKPQGG
jgi:hypothetical protein